MAILSHVGLPLFIYQSFRMMMYFHIDGINHLVIWDMDIVIFSTVAGGQKILVIGEKDD